MFQTLRARLILICVAITVAALFALTLLMLLLNTISGIYSGLAFALLPVLARTEDLFLDWLASALASQRGHGFAERGRAGGRAQHDGQEPRRQDFSRGHGQAENGDGTEIDTDHRGQRSATADCGRIPLWRPSVGMR